MGPTACRPIFAPAMAETSTEKLNSGSLGERASGTAGIFVRWGTFCVGETGGGKRNYWMTFRAKTYWAQNHRMTPGDENHIDCEQNCRADWTRTRTGHKCGRALGGGASPATSVSAPGRLTAPSSRLNSGRREVFCVEAALLRPGASPIREPASARRETSPPPAGPANVQRALGA